MVEIRDKMTFIPALAVRLNPFVQPGISDGFEKIGRLVESTKRNCWLLSRAGFGVDPDEQGRYILLVDVRGGSGRAHCDPCEWGGRTFPVAHQWLIEHWDEFESGGVVDVEFILGETEQPKRSEIGDDHG